MKLNTLKLTNFMGIRDMELRPLGRGMNIFGDNGTGKTTIASAFHWLLFDKDSQGKVDFDIKTLDANGKPLSGLDHSVEAELDLDDSTIVLKRSYREVWTKKRNTPKATFTGHTTDYFIDGVPVQKKEYDAAIESIADEDVFKLLTSPTYFNEQLHWQDRRKLLLEVCGDVSDADVIASDEALASLPGILGDRAMDDHRKVIRARMTKINKELNDIKVRVDEASHGLPDITGLDKAALESDISKLKADIRAREQQISRIEEGGEIAEKTKQLREIEAELYTIRNEHQSGYNKKIIEAQKNLYNVQGKLSEIGLSIENAQKAIEYGEKSVDELGTKIERLREQWHDADSERFSYGQEETCPTCGQALPLEKLREAREKALADFNQRKAARLEEITSEGKRLKIRKDALDKEIIEKQGQVRQNRESLDAISKEADAATSNLEQIKAAMDDYTSDPNYQDKLQEKEVFEAAIRELKDGNYQEVDGIRAKIIAVQAQLMDVESKKSNITLSEQGLKRIEELRGQERTLAAEYEILEQEKDLCDEFVRAKVRLLDEKINSRFKLARFKLFEVQVNGGIDDVCETTFEGVTWGKGLNSGMMTNVGLDIINTLSEHYSFSAPIFVDNSESVTRLLSTRGQLIRLVVSEEDKTLRVEVK